MRSQWTPAAQASQENTSSTDTVEFKDEKEFSMTSNIRDNDQVLLLSPKNKKKNVRASFFTHHFSVTFTFILMRNPALKQCIQKTLWDMQDTVNQGENRLTCQRKTFQLKKKKKEIKVDFAC